MSPTHAVVASKLAEQQLNTLIPAFCGLRILQMYVTIVSSLYLHENFIVDINFDILCAKSRSITLLCQLCM